MVFFLLRKTETARCHYKFINYIDECDWSTRSPLVVIIIILIFIYCRYPCPRVVCQIVPLDPSTHPHSCSDPKIVYCSALGLFFTTNLSTCTSIIVFDVLKYVLSSYLYWIECVSIYLGITSRIPLKISSIVCTRSVHEIFSVFLMHVGVQFTCIKRANRPGIWVYWCKKILTTCGQVSLLFCNFDSDYL